MKIRIRKNRHVEKGTDDSGGKWKSVETNNKLKETYKKGGYKSKQVTDRETGDTKGKTVIKRKTGPKTSNKEVIKTKNGDGTYKYTSNKDPKSGKYFTHSKPGKRGKPIKIAKKVVEKGIVDTDPDGRRNVYITSTKTKTPGGKTIKNTNDFTQKNIRTLKEKNAGIKSFLEKRYNTGEKKKVKKSKTDTSGSYPYSFENKTDTVKKFEKSGKIKSKKVKFTEGKKDEKPSYKVKTKINYLSDGEVSKAITKSDTYGKSKIYRANDYGAKGREWNKPVTKKEYRRIKKDRK